MEKQEGVLVLANFLHLVNMNLITYFVFVMTMVF